MTVENDHIAPTRERFLAAIRRVERTSDAYLDKRGRASRDDFDQVDAAISDLHRLADERGRLGDDATILVGDTECSPADAEAFAHHVAQLVHDRAAAELDRARTATERKVLRKALTTARVRLLVCAKRSDVSAYADALARWNEKQNAIAARAARLRKRLPRDDAGRNRHNG